MKAGAQGFGETSYVAGGDSSDAMLAFQPPFRSADAEVLPNRERIVSRSRDLARNNGWTAGGIVKEVDAVVGSRFRPLLKPDWMALGLSSEWAAEFKNRVEARWRNYAEDPRKLCDLTRSQTVGQMFALAYRNYIIEGEALGIVSWRPERPTATVLRVVDPDLLSTPADLADETRLRSGVELDRHGAAFRYHFRQAHAASPYADEGQFTWKALPREKGWGRPVVMHFFDKFRDGQTRGVSRLAPIIETLRMEDHYGRVELQAAVINAVLAAFIKSPMGPEAMDELFGEGDGGNAILGYHENRQSYYEARDGVRMGNARITQLFPGDEIGMVSTSRPAAQFAEFEGAVLRKIASGLGISYEQLAADWSKTNYSSARAALVEIWRGWTSRRVSFAQGFCQPFFMAWLEEEIDTGRITLPRGAPSFRENWSAYSRAKWIGPGKGFVDPVKEAQAAAMRVALGLSTLEEEAAELTGSDWLENMEQIKREIGVLPEGSLHPVQESFARLLGQVGSPLLDERT
ncbi:phage portal protein [Limimaricola pyoseonensis]|uniref:phage portal protein n=1 Tax=Limimaricola pyoseonensis TaxID=521013 RepID=UPI001F622148|nr:phage portal protein [Limimaricola pyoseonensis]